MLGITPNQSSYVSVRISSPGIPVSHRELNPMRRFSFKIDLTKTDKLSSAPAKPKKGPPPVADGFEMSGDLALQRQSLRAWPQFQAELEGLPDIQGTLEPWADENLAAEYVRIYQVSRQKVSDSAPGFGQEKKTETHCFFAPDGTKHLVSRLLARPHDRINEIRFSPDGTLIRLYYENCGGESQSLEDLFEHGLLGLEEDTPRFAQFPHYAMRFFILQTEGEFLKASFRGVSFFDPDSGTILTEEAESL